jgi:hypothetical protein
LPGDGPELSDGRTRAAGHGERQPAVVEQRPPGGARSRAHQRHRAGGEPSGVERRAQRVVLDRLGGAQRVGADAHHDGVAGAHDARGVGEHVGPALEHEPDDTERRPARRHRPAGVLDRPDRAVALQVAVAPGAQAGDHVVAHAVGQDEAGRRPSGVRGAGDVGVVGDPDGGHDVVVGEGGSEGVEERRDLGVVARAEGGERLDRRVHGARRLGVFGRWHVQDVAGLLDHDEAIATTERRRQLRPHAGHAVAAIDDRLADVEVVEQRVVVTGLHRPLDRGLARLTHGRSA